ncbi:MULTISPECIES: nicotinate-nucleotide adenylyltransferase [unclassified Fusibacter]|uniref:nicotinate-nucleotide adenylyltransferase n=1 Tax=unclassified Fusibacter TaxID=2624464 RepID=UPI001011DFC3|nr:MULTISPECIES: nicotinate-nucleotide adenylyltransferase [unclassified Fusibacter]MCK8060684.1 nicotinate-nucleotide adenylyltransferase [Fusibacter sp. A2]NPE22862.1 nicotinate-nucleotide adenylyltransferase [Fusibacter sp. A1]RXV59931.1 nicotinate-nucleotide adenylyltransferase [Fusibacter sp. A1]
MKTGIMGGTFDPIHFGHLFLAEEVMHTYKLDRIVFVPSKIGPHKLNRYVTPAVTRLEMVCKATESNPAFEVSSIEIDREGISYTIDTISAFRETWKTDEFYFITGADAIVTIETWKDFTVLLENVEFVAATRPSVEVTALNRQVDRLGDLYGAKIHIMSLLNLEISSSDIRSRIREGRSIKYLVPYSVEQIIKERHLYEGPLSAN